jgi:enoyl-CoA hydratase/carnithine racemase
MPVHESERFPGVFQLTIDNPSKRNALSADIIAELANTLERLAADDALRVGILTAVGDVFCSGGDTARMGAARPSPIGKRDYLDHGVGRLARLLVRLDKPIIAAVNGPAIGAGMDLALWCDFRMAVSKAYLLPGFIDLCLPPGFGGAWHLAHLLGRSQALEILLTGQKISAENAFRLGLFRSVSSTTEQLDSEVSEFARMLASKPLPAVRVTKRLVQRAPFVDVMDSMDLAWSSFGMLQETPEHVEAVRRLRHRSGGNSRR